MRPSRRGRRRLWPTATLFCLAFAGTSARAAEETFKPRENVWAVGLHTRSLHFAIDNQQDLEMTSSSIDISRVWVKPDWWANIDVSLVVSPWSQRRSLSPPIDYSGSGFSARLAYPLTGPMRRESGDWGLTLGLESMELIGRSHRRENLASGSYTEGWTVRARWATVLPGIFYSTLKPARPKGNRPEWLMTRIEGYTFVLAAAYPFQGQFKQSFRLNADPIRSSNTLKGYALQLAISAWLGI